MAASHCPMWCLGRHAATVEHHSARTPVGELLVELIQGPGDERVYLSLLEPHDGGAYFVLPLDMVPLLATAAPRIAAAKAST